MERGAAGGGSGPHSSRFGGGVLRRPRRELPGEQRQPLRAVWRVGRPTQGTGSAAAAVAAASPTERVPTALAVAGCCPTASWAAGRGVGGGYCSGLRRAGRGRVQAAAAVSRGAGLSPHLQPHPPLIAQRLCPPGGRPRPPARAAPRVTRGGTPRSGATAGAPPFAAAPAGRGALRAWGRRGERRRPPFAALSGHPALTFFSPSLFPGLLGPASPPRGHH